MIKGARVAKTHIFNLSLEKKQVYYNLNIHRNRLLASNSYFLISISFQVLELNFIHLFQH